VQSYVNSCDVERLLHGIRLKDPRSGKTRLARAIDIVVKGEEEARHLHKCDDGEEAANVNYENDEFDFEFSAAAGVVCRVKMTITEGMNRQVRRMFSSLGKEVVELKRISMGPLLLSEALAPGDVSILTDEQIKELRAAVGLDLISTNDK